ncbi:AraC family transcriptional regulator [Levilactobacillus tujiorum]|uniref:AraC family transcriptional regulator n=1 Tax=Levilactobacillus tujiorum TaxID=2912243 RepID=UPI0014564CE8|nr:AraC family transcriptional regulator [Levilactobacillus tujiorum]NLR30927.1 AraC family transcriptional regulator [Levilactobacillus tujiorum]
MQHFNELLIYLEHHLDDPADSAIARIAGTSAYHFRHMFGYLAGTSLTVYLKWHRLARANEQLRNGKTVLAVAMDAGYQSAEGFSRAYQEWHGMMPSVVASQDAVKTAPSFRFQLTIKGETSMEYQLKELPAFNLMGVTARVPLQFEGENPAITELAKSITVDQQNAMHIYADLEPHGIINADFDAEDYTKEDSQLIHMIGVRSTHREAEAGLTVIAVPALTWAIFTSRGPFPETMQATWAATASQWLPDSGYELVAAPQISHIDYSRPADNRTTEIWLAVRKRG